MKKKLLLIEPSSILQQLLSYTSLLNTSLFNAPCCFATIVVHTASPVIFTAVRSISRILSIPMINAIPSVGSPTEVSTIDKVTSPTLGTPAVPMDAMVAVAITVNIPENVRLMPYAWAINTTATPCMIDVPSILMVAPRGMVKDEICFDTPTFLCSVSMDSGMVVLDVDVEKAKAITGKKFLIKIIGFNPEKIFNIDI